VSPRPPLHPPASTLRGVAARALGIAAIVLAPALSPPAALARASAGGDTPAASVGVSIDLARPGAVVPANFLGLSFETSMLGSPQLAGPSPVLATLLRNLGRGVLRLGGVSVDRTQWMGVPEALAPWSIAAIAPGDLARLSSLMSASGWRLLLGLNLGHLSAPALVEETRAASAILGSSLAGVMIGNEPDLYTHAPSAPFRRAIGAAPLRPASWGALEYEREISSLRATLAATGIPAGLYGPDTASSRWLAGYASAQGAGLAALAQHFYPLDRCSRGRLLKVAATPRGLLSAAIARREIRQVAAFARVAASHQLALRIDEANSVACAGQPGTSDTFAAALWAVEFGLIAAERGVAGINFHGGLGSCEAGGTISAPWYSPLCTLPGGRLQERPEYYALLILRSLEGCAFLPVTYRSSRNVDVHALRAPDGSLRVVIDDMEVPGPAGRAATHRTGALAGPPRGGRGPAAAARPVWIAVSGGPSYTRASVVTLSAPSASAKQGVRLGGASVAADGSVAEPIAKPLQVRGGRALVRVRPASVAVLTLRA
jgi:hypothetical protein